MTHQEIDSEGVTIFSAQHGSRIVRIIVPKTGTRNHHSISYEEQVRSYFNLPAIARMY